MGFSDVEIEKFRLRVGDLLVCEGGEPGRCAVVTEATSHFLFQKALHRVRPLRDIVDAKMLQYFLRHSISSEVAIERRSQTTIQHLPREKMLRVWVRLPPRAEQARIVAKIEELFSDLDAAVGALERAKANLVRHRASVLRAAVEGKLTAEWRKRHPDIEPASKFLERILAERRKKWEEAELAKYASAGKTPPNNWRDKYEEPAAPDPKGLPALPKGWCWANMDQLVANAMNGYGNRSGASGEQVIVLRLADIANGAIDLSSPRRIASHHGDIEKYKLDAGDLLAIRVNGTRDLVGRLIIAGDFPEKVLFCDHFIRVRLVDRTLAAYLRHAFASFSVRKAIESKMVSTAGQHTISQSSLAQIALPLPPVEEGQEILKELESTSDLARRTEELVAAQLLKAARLRQSILKRAFQGKLVPQNPNDEPASRLIERIKAERETAQPPKPRAPARKRTAKDTV